ncbi:MULTISPECIES: hypothetical protein [Streptomyces]|uniref:hypothetical protein n=1 Tax=Streptomyces TaxID=1883 RepID=UPI0004C8F9FF|nr:MULTISPECIES: hypothetical protein [Streptomyces]RPK94456.1 hypothetical protein EES46_01355 [Streptomyces sp. ADI98-10]
MSRTQWWSLTALLAVVVGLLCGPAATAVSSGAAPGGSAPSASAPVSVEQARTRARAQAPVVEAADADTRVPGCGKLRDHEGEPGLPSRARTAYDQAPGLAPWGLPAATGALPAEPPPGIRVRAPVPVTPSPVELSVLRV